jgi:hypothetical protein
MGEMRKAYKTLGGKLQRKRLVGGPRHSWKDNFKMILMEMGHMGT